MLSDDKVSELISEIDEVCLRYNRDMFGIPVADRESMDAIRARIKEWFARTITMPCPVDWSKVDGDIEFVAVDANGGVWPYTVKPKLYGDIWLADGEQPPEYLANIRIPVGVDWRTLCWERPNGND